MDKVIRSLVCMLMLYCMITMVESNIDLSQWRFLAKLIFGGFCLSTIIENVEDAK